MKQLTATEFTGKFVEFLKALHSQQLQIEEGSRLREPESIVDLFRLFFMDSREAELYEEANKAQENKGYDDGYGSSNGY